MGHPRSSLFIEPTPGSTEAGEYNGTVKKRALHGFGMAFLLASPIWLTFEDPPNYFNFVISLALGILLLLMARSTPQT